LVQDSFLNNTGVNGFFWEVILMEEMTFKEYCEALADESFRRALEQEEE
jgi:hypothetical protein